MVDLRRSSLPPLRKADRRPPPDFCGVLFERILGADEEAAVSARGRPCPGRVGAGSAVAPLLRSVLLIAIPGVLVGGAARPAPAPVPLKPSFDTNSVNSCSTSQRRQASSPRSAVSMRSLPRSFDIVSKAVRSSFTLFKRA